MEQTFARWFLVLWGAIVSGYAAPALWQGWRALRWPTTDGRVTAAGVRFHRGRRGGYLPEVAYGYAVRGEALAATRLCFGGWTLRSERAARAALRGAEPGTRVTVHYHPRKPQVAVLLPGILIGDLAWLAAGLVALAAGLCGWGAGAPAV